MIRPSRPAPHLFKHWSRVAACVHGSRRIILFLDFDGTLVRIAPRPNQVRLAPGARRVLGRLARHPRVTVAVISGRRRGELTRHVAIRNVHYLGLYGWERNNRSSLSASASSAIKRARGVLSRHLAGYPRVWIEDKGKSLSVHLLSAHLGRRFAYSKIYATSRSCRLRFATKAPRFGCSSRRGASRTLSPSILATTSPTSRLLLRWDAGFRSWSAKHGARARGFACVGRLKSPQRSADWRQHSHEWRRNGVRILHGLLSHAHRESIGRDGSGIAHRAATLQRRIHLPSHLPNPGKPPLPHRRLFERLCAVGLRGRQSRGPGGTTRGTRRPGLSLHRGAPQRSVQGGRRLL